MFETVEPNSRLHAMTYYLSLLTSLAVHALVLSLVLVLPLIFFRALHEDELLTFLFAPPPAPVPAPAPVPPAARDARAPVFKTLVDVDTAPTAIPAGIRPPQDDDALEMSGFMKSLNLPEVSGPAGACCVGLVAPPPAAPPKPLPPPLAPKPPLPVVTKLLESRQIFRVDPVYPELARRARVSGTVILEVTIDEEGNVAAVRVLSGHPLLTWAAVDAVKQWKYSPTVLNGEPIPVLGTITVVFHLR